MSDFYPGQHVLCVNDSHLPSWAAPLSKGEVYTVRDVAVYDGLLGVWVQELSNKINPQNGVEHGYQARRFRPLKDSALDVFRAHLEPAPKQKEPAQ